MRHTPTHTPKPESVSFIRLPELLAKRGGISSSTAYRHIAAGVLPPAVKLGPNTAAWLEHEIAAIDAARVAGATEDEVRELVARLVAARQQAAA
jgi:prophage regulatory protein